MRIKREDRRVVLAIKPDLDDVVQRWARAQKKPASRAIVETLEEMKPVLIMQAQAFEAAYKGNRAKAIELLANGTGKALSMLGAGMMKTTQAK